MKCCTSTKKNDINDISFQKINFRDSGSALIVNHLHQTVPDNLKSLQENILTKGHRSNIEIHIKLIFLCKKTAT